MYILEAIEALRDLEGKAGEFLEKLPLDTIFSVGRGTLSFFEVNEKIVFVFQALDSDNDGAVSFAELGENAEQVVKSV